MLLGKYENSIDAKNRLIIPAKIRDELGFKCVLTKGLDDCLILYPISTWQDQENRLANLPMSDPAARAFKRYIYANAFECEIDKQGRILIPANLKTAAKIEKELVTIAASDRVEIWAKEIYENDENGEKMNGEKFNDFANHYQV